MGRSEGGEFNSKRGGHGKSHCPSFFARATQDVRQHCGCLIIGLLCHCPGDNSFRPWLCVGLPAKVINHGSCLGGTSKRGVKGHLKQLGERKWEGKASQRKRMSFCPLSPPPRTLKQNWARGRLGWGGGLRGSTWCRCPGTERRLARGAIFESPGSCGMHRFRGYRLNWATGKGGESRDGAWGSSTRTVLYPQRGQLGRPERSSSERTGCHSTHRCPG